MASKEIPADARSSRPKRGEGPSSLGLRAHLSLRLLSLPFPALPSNPNTISTKTSRMASLLRLNTAIPLLTLTGLYFQWRRVSLHLSSLRRVREREGLKGNVADLFPSPSFLPSFLPFLSTVPSRISFIKSFPSFQEKFQREFSPSSASDSSFKRSFLAFPCSSSFLPLTFELKSRLFSFPSLLVSGLSSKAPCDSSGTAVRPLLISSFVRTERGT